MIRQYNYLFKVVLVGNSAVGKSSIIRRFSDDSFQESYLATIGVDFRFKSIEIQENIVKLQIWDTAGQQRFRTITGAYYKGAQAIILVYDITNQNSFADIEDFWLKEIDKHAITNVKLFIWGNKSDERNKRKVQTQQAQQFCRKNKCVFHQMSAKSGKGISEAFQQLALYLTKIYPKSQRKDQKNPVIKEIQQKKKQFQIQNATKQSSKSTNCC